MSGDATLFARRDEVEEAWAFIDPIEEAWHSTKMRPRLEFYPAGSWGPAAADELLARDGRAWRALLNLMPAATRSYSPGLPVEVGKIDRELKKLWQQNEGATRASLVNLAVYSEASGLA